MQGSGSSFQSLVVSIGAVIVAAVALVMSIGSPDPEPPRPQSGGGPSETAEDLRAELRRLRDRIAQLESHEGAAAGAGRSETPDSRRAEIEAVVARILEERGVGHDGSGDDVAAPRVAVDVNAAVAQLVENGLMGPASEGLWQQIREAGKVDEVVAAFERRARENPNSADAHADLGDAYVQQIMETPNDMEKGVVAMKADRSYDEALDIDPTHWGARFSKAVGYTFWPDFLGKKAESIQHLNVLVDQQEIAAPAPQQAQTYVILGNLYEQRGEVDKAREIWQRGATRHPDDASLKGKLKQ